MLARRLRLRRPQDFQSVRQRGKHWRDGLFTLNTLPNNLSHNRFGFVVSRRAGSAFRRNRLKRRMRAAIRQWIPAMENGFDVVVVAHESATAAGHDQMCGSLFRLFVQAGLMTDSRSA